MLIQANTIYYGNYHIKYSVNDRFTFFFTNIMKENVKQFYQYEKQYTLKIYISIDIVVRL